MVKKSNQIEYSFNLIKALNEVEEPEEAEVFHSASISEYPSSKSIYNDYDEGPSQIANFFVRDMEKQGDGLRGVVYNVFINSKR